MGVHTGDSITVAPAMTLTDREYQRMRDVGDRGACARSASTPAAATSSSRCTRRRRLVVIEMNPRVSRSSRAGVEGDRLPDRKIAAKLAVGYTLDEIPNDITGRPRRVRADARLRRRQGAAVRVREVPGADPS
jgi:carbamoyl-phosphate synthase large subunit